MTPAEIGFCRDVAEDVDPPLCPTRLPAPVSGGLDAEGTGDFVASGDCGWLRGLTYEEAGVPVFHVLTGAQCTPLASGNLRGTDPDDLLRLVGSASLQPADAPGTEAAPIAPARRGTTTVRGKRAVMLRWAGFERAGTIHGGHEGVAWNEGGAGRVLSMHFQARVDDSIRWATLRAVAAAMQ